MNRPANPSAVLHSCVPFVLSFLAYTHYVYLLGFPDGFISEQQRAQRQLAYVFIVVSLCIGVYWFYRSTAQRLSVKSSLRIAACYLVFVFGVWMVNHFYCAKLMSSAGG
jgi:hypothetical protein